ncbi:MAG: hypothetical protein KJ720_08680 [Proteobacteria bacterium]|nr:hypothetical protein [Pseudomonadota bacterium]MBU1450763.1 hypothetical protein [Pseudomonadota bacterium]MBU2468884.1 hypothetical protein [Pseudomonadota bacterium]MBU2517782.1 hypothetical protein [Pseudomonadota bacterium]
MMGKTPWAALALAVLALGLAAPAQGKDLHQAMKEMAADIKAQHQAAGRSNKTPPTQSLGSTKTVSFILPMKAGQGRDSVSQDCLGYTLRCTAVVRGPHNIYSGKVATSEGGKVEFTGKKDGQPLEMTLPTAFWGGTTFSLFMRAQREPFPERAEVALTCSY